MFNRAWLPTVAAAGLIVVTAFTAACGSKQSQAPGPGAAATARGPGAGGRRRKPQRADPITVLIDASQQHFLAGERELKLGHLERARTEFDRAVEVLLESPYGARTRRPAPGTFRPAGRPDQRLRGDGPRPGRRVLGKGLRTGVHRRAPHDRDVPQAGARRPPPRRPSRRTSRPPNTTCRSRKTIGCWPTSSSSRAGCATTSRRA